MFNALYIYTTKIQLFLNIDNKECLKNAQGDKVMKAFVEEIHRRENEVARRRRR